VFTGASRTPVVDGGKAPSLCLPVTRPESMRGDRRRGQQATPARQRRSRVTHDPSPRPNVTARAVAPGIFPARPPSETLAPALSRAYKKAPSTLQNTTPPEHHSPALLSSSLPRKCPSSASLGHCVPGVPGHRWSCCWCEVEEPSSRRQSASSLSSSSSPASSFAVEPYTCHRR
jgi:hypothetical protein